ncbi:MAG: VOC family protein [Candidatus Aminicenantes bacterium]|nr:VOC family protein [Candidatus Aminicenantes bacterium]
MPRVVHFEISVDDPERAISFYEDVFGWKIEKWEGPVDYWLITTGPENEPGIDGAFMRRQDPAVPTINTVSVASADEFLTKITQAGGKVITPKQTIPGVGYSAYCQDTEGNTFGIIEENLSAKE